MQCMMGKHAQENMDCCADTETFVLNCDHYCKPRYYCEPLQILHKGVRTQTFKGRKVPF